jgi:hypothetical protein
MSKNGTLTIDSFTSIGRGGRRERLDRSKSRHRAAQPAEPQARQAPEIAVGHTWRFPLPLGPAPPHEK